VVTLGGGLFLMREVPLQEGRSVPCEVERGTPKSMDGASPKCLDQNTSASVPGSEEGSYLRLTDLYHSTHRLVSLNLYHSTLGLRVIKKKKENHLSLLTHDQ